MANSAAVANDASFRPLIGPHGPHRATFEADKYCQFDPLWRALSTSASAPGGATHQFVPRRGRVADAALHFHADDFELRILCKGRGKSVKRFGDSIEFGPRLLPTAMVILFIGKEQHLILTVVEQEYHQEIHGLRKNGGPNSNAGLEDA